MESSDKGIIFGLTLWQILLSGTLLLFPIVYNKCSVFKYYTKLTIFYATALLSAVVVILYSLPRPRNWRNHLLVRMTCQYFLRPLFGLEIVVRGQDIFKEDMAAIVVINHQSSVDMIPVFANWPDSTVVLAKKEIWYTGTFGLAAWLSGTVYIDRSNSSKARKTMDDTVNIIKTKKLKVVVFPEGTRNHEGSLLPFKKGAFHIAVQAQVPVIPVVMSSYDKFYSKSEKRFDEGKIIMETLPPIPTDGLTADNVTELTEKTRDVMLKCFERISQEAKKDDVVM